MASSLDPYQVPYTGENSEESGVGCSVEPLFVGEGSGVVGGRGSLEPLFDSKILFSWEILDKFEKIVICYLP